MPGFVSGQSDIPSTIPPNLSQYDLAFQVAPIILVNGITEQTQGGITPITTYTPGGMPADLDSAFARYLPIPGGTLVSQSIATYPFANQSIAANATIQQPLALSMLMIAPVNQPGGYTSKLPAFTQLQQKLTAHNALGGMFIIATPAYVYGGDGNYMLLLSMSDMTEDDQKQKQIIWRLDFVQPLLTLAAAQQAQSGLMSKLTAGQQISGTPSWSGNTSSSPANQPGVTGALGNVQQALATFGGSLGSTPSSS